MRAVAKFISEKSCGSNVSGFVQFVQNDDEEFVKVFIAIRGLPDGKHGIHVHEKSVTDVPEIENCCESLGGHFNVSKKFSETFPYGIKHGSFELKTTRHTGDLCNNVNSVDGLASFEYNDGLISLRPGHPANIIGRSVVVHDKEDDCGQGKNIESEITGNAGSRIACAEIKYV